MHTFVDRGGTFTDVVQCDNQGRWHIEKVPSDKAVMGNLASGALVFGTTVATNALLERTGVPTLLLVTEGFEDLVYIGDMTRPHLFAPEAVWPAPLCQQVAGISGRIDADGEIIVPLSATLPDLTNVAAVAVVLMNSVHNPAHELAVARRIRQLHPTLHVAVGHACSPELGYLSRIETTLVDAAITPVLQAALIRDQIPAGALAMRSDGSLTPGRALRAPDAVLSGPAGGVLAVSAVAKQAGFRHAVGLDMGGTSTDVCCLDIDRLPYRHGDTRVAGHRLRRSMLAVDTIAAGGGSVLWNDGLRMGVGPTSAGANPGPQCYGRGGPPTLTDAALSMGLVDPNAFTPPLRKDAVDLPGSAAEFVAVARDQMANAVRRMATADGRDLRSHALVAFGGAAGQHAAGVAERLQIKTVLFHPCAAVLSAWGQSLATREDTHTEEVWQPLEVAWPTVLAAWTRGLAALPQAPHIRKSLFLQYQGTDHAFEVHAEHIDEAREQLRIAHRAQFGFDRDANAEVVRTCVRAAQSRQDLPAYDHDPWQIGDGERVGPAVLFSPTTAIEVPDGWTAQRINGLLVLTHHAAKPPRSNTVRTPYGVSLWSHRFMAVAEQAGEVLRRLARSVSIRDRLDFSCAVFDERGGLVANAPHIPVHLGAMGATVRDLLATTNMEPGQAWLCNAPDAGGSHLPDLTVVNAVHHQGRRFFVASRGHHVDIGGMTPGSMPPHSTTLSEEGVVLRHLPLLRNGELIDLRPHLVGVRQVDTVRADLQAQLAANHHASQALIALGDANLIAAWMAHLQDVAAEGAAQVLANLPAQRITVQDSLRGVPLSLALSVEAHQLHVDLSATGGPHAGNLNAPLAVVRAAVLYALRLLMHRDLPLNEGVFRAVRIQTRTPSLLSPPPNAAVAGGNVETSQRLVDLMLRATGTMAASCGTMSNLTLGGEGWSLYETIGGGQGATPGNPGIHGRQVHMTNTRATDPEVLEARLPVRLLRFAFRRHSGGVGQHPGGDGLIREFEMRSQTTAALLATRRGMGAPGLGYGGTGKPGSDQLYRDNTWLPWDGSTVQLSPGDRVLIETPGGGGYTPIP